MGRHPGQILFLFAYLIKGKMLSCRGRGLVYGCIAELQLCINRMWIIIVPRRVLSGEEFLVWRLRLRRGRRAVLQRGTRVKW